jgi:hypothetical protein
MKAPSERRQSPRVASESPVRIYRTDGSQRVHDAVCRDVSAGGAGVRLEIVLAVGEVVEFEFSEKDQQRTSRRRARVIYRKSWEYGLAFLE